MKRLPVVVDENYEPHLYPVLSTYVERWWTPVVGPTSMFLLRTLVREGSRTWELEELAYLVGRPGDHGRHSPLIKSLHRLVRYCYAVAGKDALIVPEFLPVLPYKYVSRMPAAVRDELRLVDHKPGRVGA